MKLEELLYTIHYRYEKTRTWNCDNPYNEKDYFKMLDHERLVGNKVIFNGSHSATVYIDY